MEWRASEVFNLINLYKQFECLWNYKSSTYKRIDLKRNAWVEISNKCGKEVDEVKKKIKHLWSAYVAEKKRVENSKKSGSSTDSLYESHLFYFAEMQFLDSVVVLRKTVSTLETRRVELGEEAEESFGDFISEDLQPPSSSPFTWLTATAITPVPSPSAPIPVPIPTPSPSQPSSSLSSSSLSSSSSSSRRRKHSSNRDNKFDRAIEAIVASATAEDNDIFSSCSKTIALQLKQLTLVEATETMSEIQQLVSLKVIKSVSQSQSPSGDLLQTALFDADITFQ